jgi:hypothetical protein
MSDEATHPNESNADDLVEAPAPLPPIDVAAVARTLLEAPSVEIGATITDVGVLVTILIPNDNVAFAVSFDQEEEPEADGSEADTA